MNFTNGNKSQPIMGIMKRLSTDRDLRRQYEARLVRGQNTDDEKNEEIGNQPQKRTEANPETEREKKMGTAVAEMPRTTVATTPQSSGRFQIKKAERRQKKLRLAIDGPSGSGKTYTALMFSFVLGKRVCVIDTEHSSASLYASENPGWEFDKIDLTTYSPSLYAEAIQYLGTEKYDVIIIDSLSHAWEGKDGALDQVDKKSGANKFTAWKDVSPQHRQMVEAILASPCHVIATMRTKTEYLLEERVNPQTGKSSMVPVKLGLAPIQRAGVEYEFDLVIDMDLEHCAKVSKTRCAVIDGKVWHKPGAEAILPVIEWLNSGSEYIPVVAPPVIAAWISDEQKSKILELSNVLGTPIEAINRGLSKFSASTLSDLTAAQADQVIGGLQSRIKVAEQKAKADQMRAEAAAKTAQAPAPAPTTEKATSPVVNPPAAAASQPPANPTTPPASQPTQSVVAPIISESLIRPEQIASIKGIMEELKKLPQWGTPTLPADCLEKSIKSRGFESLKKLTPELADTLIEKMRAVYTKLKPSSEPAKEPAKEVTKTPN